MIRTRTVSWVEHPQRRGHVETTRRAFSLPDLFWIIFIILLLVAILLPSLSREREITKRAVCSTNLRGLAQACKIYSNDNQDWYPHHPYFQAKPDPEKPRDHGVQWVGTMGSNDFLKITESSMMSPKKNHPSRSLFMFVIDGTCTAKQFLCPSAGDAEDDLRNYTNNVSVASQPGADRFDFAGYHCLSYGYQLPYGPKAKPNENLDPRMVIMADKGPYYTVGGEGLPGTHTIRDQRSNVEPPQAWASRGADGILGIGLDEWRPFNSRSHQREGQNVQFQDGHVSFEKRPIVGVNYDNIYTLQADFNPVATMIGLMPDPTQTIGPLTQTDSFIVP